MFSQYTEALKDIPPIGIDLITKLVEKFFPFKEFNEGQKDAIITAINAFVNKKKKHVIIEAPTGVGKSLIGITTHLVINHIVNAVAKQRGTYGQFRTSISTPTKGLQDQYAKEEAANIAILKGKKNYRCLISPDLYYNSIPCKMACSRKECSARECPYVRARNIWTNMSSLRCTNAAMMTEMCTTLCDKPENRADMLILDECHEMPHTLLDHTIMNFDIRDVKDIHTFDKQLGTDILNLYVKILDLSKDYEKGKLYTLDHNFCDLFDALHSNVEAYLEVLEAIVDSENIEDRTAVEAMNVVDILQNVSDYCQIMSNTNATTFILNEKEAIDGTPVRIEFKPVYPADVSEFGLFRKADYILHMSATICGVDAYARSLGITDYEEIQVANPIPLENRKIMYAPVMKMNNNMGDYEYKQLANAIDDIIDYHSGQSGIIHTVSYDRAQKILEHSRHKRILLLPKDRRDIMSGLNRAIETKIPCVIVSPAIEKGWDFKGDLSRFTIIIKTPYEYLGDPLIAYINQKDPSAYFREAVLRIVQMAGRSVRGVDDYASTYILDSSFEMLLAKNGVYFPDWFKDAIFEL